MRNVQQEQGNLPEDGVQFDQVESRGKVSNSKGQSISKKDAPIPAHGDSKGALVRTKQTFKIDRYDTAANGPIKAQASGKKIEAAGGRHVMADNKVTETATDKLRDVTRKKKAANEPAIVN